jgi:hypothetical protein
MQPSAQRVEEGQNARMSSFESAAEEPVTRTPAWLIDLTILLGLSVVVLGAWLIQELRAQPEVSARRALTVPAATRIIDTEIGAFGSYLAGAYSAIHTADAVLVDRTTGEELHGREELRAAIAGGTIRFAYSPVRTTDVERVGDDVAVYGLSWGLDTPSQQRGAGIVIVTFEDGKISREVVVPMGGVRATDSLLPE